MRADKVTAAVLPPNKHNIYTEWPNRWQSLILNNIYIAYTEFLIGPIYTDCPQTSNTNDRIIQTEISII